MTDFVYLSTKSRTMEIHDSRPVDYRWHIMMMMMGKQVGGGCTVMAEIAMVNCHMIC